MSIWARNRVEERVRKEQLEEIEGQRKEMLRGKSLQREVAEDKGKMVFEQAEGQVEEEFKEGDVGGYQQERRLYGSINQNQNQFLYQEKEAKHRR